MTPTLTESFATLADLAACIVAAIEAGGETK